MKKLDEQARSRLWRQVMAEFPDDRVMQEVHFARLVHHEMFQGESSESLASFLREEARKTLGSLTTRKEAVSV